MGFERALWACPVKSRMGLSPGRYLGMALKLCRVWDSNGLARARANPMGPLWPTEIPGGFRRARYLGSPMSQM